MDFRNTLYSAKARLNNETSAAGGSKKKSSGGRRFQVTTSREHNASLRGKELCKRICMNFRKSSLFRVARISGELALGLLR
jgi:hypothetical protein